MANARISLSRPAYGRDSDEAVLYFDDNKVSRTRADCVINSSNLGLLNIFCVTGWIFADKHTECGKRTV